MWIKTPEIIRNRKMYTASETMDRARPIAAALVEREVRITQSRMTAYERVASRLGVSSSWLQKLIGRRPVAIAAHEFLNLATAYRCLCERIEAEAEAERKATETLKEMTNAALESAFLPVVASTPETTVSAAAHPAMAQSARR